MNKYIIATFTLIGLDVGFSFWYLLGAFLLTILLKASMLLFFILSATILIVNLPHTVMVLNEILKEMVKDVDR